MERESNPGKVLRAGARHAVVHLANGAPLVGAAACGCAIARAGRSRRVCERGQPVPDLRLAARALLARVGRHCRDRVAAVRASGPGPLARSPLAAPLAHRLVILGFPVAAAARFLAAVVDLVHGRPGAPLRLVFWQASLFVAFLDVFRLTFLLAGVVAFVSAWHVALL